MLFVCYPKCTTCQRARAYLISVGASFEERDIKEQNPTADELAAWQRMSGLPLNRFFNTSGLLYRSMGLKDKLADMTDGQKLELLASDGMLVKRPILITDSGVLVGFREAEWQKLIKG